MHGGSLREGQISFLSEGGEGTVGRFQKGNDLGPGSERLRLSALPDPDGEGLVNPSQGIWLNPTESVESLCIFLIF